MASAPPPAWSDASSSSSACPHAGPSAQKFEMAREVRCYCWPGGDCIGARHWSLKREGDPVALRLLRRMLATRYYWTGSFCKDYWFFVANWHPLLGLFLSHPSHPWKKRQRVLGLFVTCCLTAVAPALVVGYFSLPLRGGADETLQLLSDTISQTAVFLYITLPATVLSVLLYYMALLTGTYFVGNDNCCRGCMACCCTCVRRCCFTCVFCVALWIFVISVSIVITLGSISKMQLSVAGLLGSYAMSLVQSWLVWFPLYFFMPCCGFLLVWRSELKAISAANKNGEASLDSVGQASIPWQLNVVASELVKDAEATDAPDEESQQEDLDSEESTEESEIEINASTTKFRRFRAMLAKFK